MAGEYSLHTRCNIQCIILHLSIGGISAWTRICIRRIPPHSHSHPGIAKRRINRYCDITSKISSRSQPVGIKKLTRIGEELVRQSRLSTVDDVFFVDLAEVRAGLAGWDLRPTVVRRREVYQRELRRRHLPRVLLSDGTEPEAVASEAVPTVTRPDGVLVGTAASAGVATAAVVAALPLLLATVVVRFGPPRSFACSEKIKRAPDATPSPVGRLSCTELTRFNRIYFRMPSFLISTWYRSRSSRWRYFRRRARLPTIMRRPRRDVKSFLWILRCSVRWLICSVMSATCTSGLPVSFSFVRNDITAALRRS